MAIFDYQCDDCHHTWEVWVTSSSDQPMECPECGSPKMHKLVTWHGMYTGEHKKAWDRPPPGNKITVGGTKVKKK